MTIDEDSFIASFVAGLPQAGSVVVPPGDDCAAIAWDADHLLLLAIDQVAADTHYYGPAAVEPTPARLAGRKLLARNLSDIAAMGGTPLYALAAAALPPGTAAARLQAFAEGLRELADEFGVSLVGGDIGSAGAEVASLAVVGRVRREHICLRSAARAGECLLVTGRLGGSLASGRHLTFQPRVAEGRWLAENGWCRCMMDLSDGLLQDLQRLCRAAGVGAQLHRPALPCNDSVDAALADGEDYELLLTVDAEHVDALQTQCPFDLPLTVIGRMRAGEPVIVDENGGALAGGGFDHFS